ncbi:MAG: hypothetical protein WA962_14470 [Ornithinimicrobium sp.]
MTTPADAGDANAVDAPAVDAPAGATPARTTRPGKGHPQHGRRLLVAALLAGVLSMMVAALGISVRAADVGAAAVDEPQYLLTATSLWEDGDLDISDERAAGRADAFYDGALPVQTSVLQGGARISPHDPLLPVLLAPAVGLGGWVGAKIMLSVTAGLLAAAIAWVVGTRWKVPPMIAGTVAAVAGTSAPLAVYGNQVYPELPAALVVVIAVAAILPRSTAQGGSTEQPRGWSPARALVLVLAITALPWLAVKYVLVAAALAAVALVRMRSTDPRMAAFVTAILALSGAIWLTAHRLLYGGWTAYATGDHFAGSGEFGAVGFAPDYFGRSTRLIGLLVDRDYGLAAWQPAWLLVIPAVGLLWGALRSGHRAASSGVGVLTLPLLAGWLTAVFVALTMHGFWWPGRQLVVVLPLAAMLIAIALARADLPARRVVLAAAGVMATIGVLVQGWVLTAGQRGSLTWVGAPNVTPPAPLGLLRSVLPDYRELGAADWTLHALWVCAALGLLVGGWVLGRRLHHNPVKDSTP